jgi:mannose-6-phosphate isomerase
MSPSGLSLLPDGRRLVDALDGDPVGFLGPEHLASFGPDPMLLVKLLESAVRLLIHCHPDREFAHRHLNCSHGKTEAWFVMSAGPDAQVFLGFSEDVTNERLESLVYQQQVEKMLALLNPIRVVEGDSILVPAGVPHAIGSGILVLELQEPTDFSVVLETNGLPSPELGMGWQTALGCVDCSRWSSSRLEHLKCRVAGADGRIFPPAADPFFRANLFRVRPARDTGLEQGFAVLVVINGKGELQGEFEGSPLALSKGATVLIPHATRTAEFRGSMDVVVCRPPLPGGEQPPRPRV